MTDTMTDIHLKDHFLISMPHMSDRNFSHTLTYICDHSEDGAMGIVINRPMELSLKDILNHLDMATETMQDQKVPVYSGGPVQGERGFVLHSPGEEWTSSHIINEHIQLSTSLDILQSIAEGKGPEQFLVALGYAGWGAGQLEAEIGNNAWLSCPANLDIMFSTTAEKRLDAAASLLGINLDLLTSESGHG